MIEKILFGSALLVANLFFIKYTDINAIFYFINMIMLLILFIIVILSFNIEKKDNRKKIQVFYCISLILLNINFLVGNYTIVPLLIIYGTTPVYLIGSILNLVSDSTKKPSSKKLTHYVLRYNWVFVIAILFDEIIKIVRL